MPSMKIKLYHPLREISLRGPREAAFILKELNLPREAYLVICEEALVPEDAILSDEAEVEIRPVISGG
ncbi:MAG: thiamine biosynthesis protein ThiS [Nitrospiria bacterium]